MPSVVLIQAFIEYRVYIETLRWRIERENRERAENEEGEQQGRTARENERKNSEGEQLLAGCY
jgi:hypothetical protein